MQRLWLIVHLCYLSLSECQLASTRKIQRTGQNTSYASSIGGVDMNGTGRESFISGC